MNRITLIAAACSLLVIVEPARSQCTPPSCTITGPTSACQNATGLSYCGPAGMDAYAWAICGNGTIVGSSTTQCISVTAGLPGSFAVTLVTTLAGCPSNPPCSFAVTVNPGSCPNPNHVVCGQSPDGGTPLQLFTAAYLEGQSGHGPSFDPSVTQGIAQIQLTSSYAQPRFGGYSFSTNGFADIGLDFAAPSCSTDPPPCTNDPNPHALYLNYLNPPVSTFTVYLRRLSYSIPTEFSLYSPSGVPVMTEDVPFAAPISTQYDYGYGNQSNGGHVHPLFLMRRPGLLVWHMRFVSDSPQRPANNPPWGWSDEYIYSFTSIPGRGLLVPINMSSIFNADVVDSDGSDTPTPFDASGNMWVLNGNYGTTAGLPVNGQLDGFQLGGPSGSGLTGSNNNVLLANGSLNLASTLNLVTTGQADTYLSLEFLVAGAGTFTTSDQVNVTLTYADATTKTITIQQASGTTWSAYRPLDNWQQTATPRPWTAIGASGDRTTGFARSTGTAIDGAAGSNFYFFRACTPVDSTKVLNQIAFANYTGSNRVGVFAILAIKKGPLVITTVSLPTAQEGAAYSQALSAAGTPPYKGWEAGGLPTGLTIDPCSGQITGTPAAGTAAGSPYSVSITCNDRLDETASITLPLTVLPRQGDINDDGAVNNTDLNLFVNVLLGTETNPTYVARSDMNASGSANGLDIPLFVAAYLQ